MSWQRVGFASSFLFSYFPLSFLLSSFLFDIFGNDVDVVVPIASSPFTAPPPNPRSRPVIVCEAVDMPFLSSSRMLPPASLSPQPLPTPMLLS